MRLVPTPALPMVKRMVFAAGLALASPAVAQTPIPQDIADGMYVTVDEVRANARATFLAFAGPSGGPIPRQTFLSRELPPGIVASTPDRELLESLFAKLDADGNGQLAWAEWNQRLNRDLQFADANNDGRITLKELSNAKENMSFGETLGMIF